VNPFFIVNRCIRGSQMLINIQYTVEDFNLYW